MPRFVVALLLFTASALAPSHLFCAKGDRPLSEYKDMIMTSVCSHVDSFTEEKLVDSVTLRYYFGIEENSNVEVALWDAARLLQHARWVPERRVALYFFGFNSDLDSSSTRSIILAYVKRSIEYNLVVVNWEEVTGQRYGVAVTMMEAVAHAVANALDMLVSAGATVGHIAGHSLGAQAAGATARFARHRVPTVVALDPAGPLFYSEALPGLQCVSAVGPNDADCVLALHTCMGVLGSPVSTGHVDFFPHGGAAPQPGCGLWGIGLTSFVCSHERAVELWAAAVANRTSLVGRRCPSWQDFQNGKCDNHRTALLGRCGNATGTFFMETNDATPFGKGEPGTVVKQH